MTGAALIQEFRRRGVHLWADGDVLRYVGPRTALAPELLSELIERKSWVLGLLGALAALSDVDLEAVGDYAEERAAILEFDGRLPRAEAERLALEATVAAFVREAGLHA